MATSRRLRGEPTEEEELARVLRESLLEAMLPVEQDSPSGDDVPVTQGLREDAVVTPEAELPMPRALLKIRLRLFCFVDCDTVPRS